jgi:hypothetical protein
MTMTHSIKVTTMTTKPQTRTSNSSVVRFGFWLDVIDFLLQDRGYQVFRALLGKQALRFLTIRCVEVVGVLARIAVNVFASSK